MILTKNASRHGKYSAQQRLGFRVALYTKKSMREVEGCCESQFMFPTEEP